jgi:hypothetical protein
MGGKERSVGHRGGEGKNKKARGDSRYGVLLGTAAAPSRQNPFGLRHNCGRATSPHASPASRPCPIQPWRGPIAGHLFTPREGRPQCALGAREGPAIFIWAAPWCSTPSTSSIATVSIPRAPKRSGRADSVPSGVHLQPKMDAATCVFRWKECAATVGRQHYQ